MGQGSALAKEPRKEKFSEGAFFSSLGHFTKNLIFYFSAAKVKNWFLKGGAGELVPLPARPAGGPVFLARTELKVLIAMIFSRAARPRSARGNGVNERMEIIRSAMAGTLESGDAQVTVEPSGGGVTFELTSGVINQFGGRIREVVTETLEKLGVKSARVPVVDNGALDYAIRARVECAAFRAAGAGENIPWGDLPR